MIDQQRFIMCQIKNILSENFNLKDMIYMLK